MGSTLEVIRLIAGIGLVVHGGEVALRGWGAAVGAALVGGRAEWARTRRGGFLLGLAAAAGGPTSRSLAAVPRCLRREGRAAHGAAEWAAAGTAFAAALAVALVAFASLEGAAALPGYAALGAGACAAGRRGRLSAAGQGALGLGLAWVGAATLGAGAAGLARELGPLVLPSSLVLQVAVGALAGCGLGLAARSVGLAGALVGAAAAGGLVELVPAQSALLGALASAPISRVRAARRDPGEARTVAWQACHALLVAAIGLAMIAWIAALSGKFDGAVGRPGPLIVGYAWLATAVGTLVLAVAGGYVLDVIESRLPAPEADPDGGAAALREELAVLPAVAEDGLLARLARASESLRRIARAVLRHEPITEFRLRSELAAAEALALEARAAAERGDLAPLPPPTARALGLVELGLRGHARLFGRVASLAGGRPFAGHPLAPRVDQAQLAVLHLLERSAPLRPGPPADALEQELSDVELQLAGLSWRILQQATEHGLSARACEPMLAHLHALAGLARGAVDLAAETEALRPSAEPRPVAPGQPTAPAPAPAPAATAPAAPQAALEEPPPALPRPGRRFRPPVPARRGPQG